jgi:hypothetical protein
MLEFVNGIFNEADKAGNTQAGNTKAEDSRVENFWAHVLMKSFAPPLQEKLEARSFDDENFWANFATKELNLGVVRRR